MKQLFKESIELGIQHSEKDIRIKSLGRKKEGIEALKTRKAFPQPKGHCITDTLCLACLLVVLSLVTVMVIYFEHFDWTSREVAFFALNAVLGALPLLIAYHLLYPIYDRKRAKKGKYQTIGKVVATDNAGKVVNDDAQQRALVEVYHQDKKYLLVANQPGLYVDSNASVKVTWNSVSQLCWIHEIHATA